MTTIALFLLKLFLHNEILEVLIVREISGMLSNILIIFGDVWGRVLEAYRVQE